MPTEGTAEWCCGALFAELAQQIRNAPNPFRKSHLESHSPNNRRLPVEVGGGYVAGLGKGARVVLAGGWNMTLADFWRAGGEWLGTPVAQRTAPGARRPWRRPAGSGANSGRTEGGGPQS